MAGKDPTNIQVYQKKQNGNIGLILFGIVFVYLVITCLSYITGRHISLYEVREGSILKDTAYTGIVLRQEQVITAEAAGYVNYFVIEGSKVGKKSNVYCISQDKLDLDSTQLPADSEDIITELTAEEQASIAQKAQSFIESYRPEQYNDVYTFKESITEVLKTNSSQSRQARLDALLQSGREGLTICSAVDDGIIIYSIDGYENLTMDQVTEDIITKTDFESTDLTNNSLVQAGDPVYKLITSDEWMVVVELDDAMAKELADKKNVRIRFSKDNETTWASFALYNTKDSNLGFFSFDHSMIRYATERFLDIELILEDESGLKIPKSALVNKDFYVVPQTYLTRGGDSNERGFLVCDEKDVAKFEKTDTYYHDIQTDMVYIDVNDFKEGTVLQKPDSKDTYTLKKIVALPGVYNVNRGYAVFREINILCEGDEYYIISSGNEYGISNYDLIALNSDDVRENSLVY